MPRLTGTHNGTQIILDVALVGINRGVDPDDPDQFLAPEVRLETLRALVDSGATSTSVTAKAVSAMGLRAVGKRNVMTANGFRPSRIYYFKVGFAETRPHQRGGHCSDFFVLPRAIEGSELNIPNAGFDILLGMDVITQGDFTIKKDGNFSFEF